MVILSIAVIVFTSIIVYYAGTYFSQHSSDIGDYLRIPRSVKGATLDAVSSSMPELMIALFSLLAFNKFEVGIGTITGSALFNLLVIPAICVLASEKEFRVGDDIIHRDGLFYILSVAVLLIALMFFPVWGLGIPLIFLAIYGLYVRSFIKQTKRFRATKEQEKVIRHFEPRKSTAIIISTILIMGVACYFLTEYAIILSSSLGIPALIISFTVISIATSVPDTVISYLNARKGQIDDSISNVFGSNVFNILVGLSIPVALAFYIIGPTSMIFEHMQLLAGLLLSTLFMMFFLAEDLVLSKKEAVGALIIYLGFVIYTVYLSI